MMINIELPTWMVKELSKYSDKSTQYLIKKTLKEVLNSKDGREILERIREIGGEDT